MSYEISWTGPYGREHHFAATAAGAMAYIDHARLKWGAAIEVTRNGVAVAIKDVEATMITAASAAARKR